MFQTVKNHASTLFMFETLSSHKQRWRVSGIPRQNLFQAVIPSNTFSMDHPVYRDDTRCNDMITMHTIFYKKRDLVVLYTSYCHD